MLLHEGTQGSVADARVIQFSHTAFFSFQVIIIIILNIFSNYCQASRCSYGEFGLFSLCMQLTLVWCNLLQSCVNSLLLEG